MSDEQQGNSPITVDVWSDVMCPFCWMGDRHLELALEEFSHRDDVKITYHSYQLMPDYPENSPLPSAEAVAKQKGMPVAQFKQMNDGVAQRGAEVGLDYNFDQALTVNSRRAHRLSHFAEQQGVQHELMQNLFKAYFTDGKNVEDREVLADLAAEVGLDRDEALAKMDNEELDHAVQADINQASQIGVQGVPFFVFNNKYAVSGAQPQQVFQQVLETVWGEANS
ncbi:DsbA family oxidoreductase [Corynebacterium ammoniagenes]|uniref:DSBA oxidoreductase n=2 Tax=Corynebacterium ammoniagenes TaxID=1697 RepID=A0AAV5GBJ7_CORAM|nr:DsbA family oxidoreductase [Corynebacterium ammoniagenes]AQS74180.1 protein-disulfide isomerase [Corynebacterium ammoniagenes]EFG82101.1 DsbA-like protein [Corynebacterium ammoniagenes DSM 20306]GJN43984.1 DSBA oxidoreductase [Corynebacterium ammoniagenes]